MSAPMKAGPSAEAGRHRQAHEQVIPIRIVIAQPLRGDALNAGEARAAQEKRPRVGVERLKPSTVDMAMSRPY